MNQLIHVRWGETVINGCWKSKAGRHSFGGWGRSSCDQNEHTKKFSLLFIFLSLLFFWPYSMAYGILVSWLTPLAVAGKHRDLTTGPPGNSLFSYLFLGLLHCGQKMHSTLFSAFRNLSRFLQLWLFSYLLLQNERCGKVSCWYCFCPFFTIFSCSIIWHIKFQVYCVQFKKHILVFRDALEAMDSQV